MSIYEVGPFQLNAERLTLRYQGDIVPLGPRVVETLLALAERAGEVLAKDALLDRIWPEGYVDEANLAQNIYVLRKTFRSRDCVDCIETIPRQGYRLIVPARRIVGIQGTPQAGQPTLKPVAAARFAALVAACVVLAASYWLVHRSTSPSPAVLSPSGSRLYQVGRYYWNLRTREGVRKSLSYFTQVIDTDPNNARGYAALADANVTMGDYCYGTHRPMVYFARAEEYAQRALALDPNSAEAHASLGFLALHRKDTESAAVAKRELLRAIAVNPSYAPAREWYGIALLRHGERSQGLQQLKIAANLDPLSVATIAWLGSVAYVDRRFGAAIAYSREALELAPQRLDAMTTIGESYEAQGQIDRAVQAFKRYGAVDPYYQAEAAALLTRAYAGAHRMPEARAQFTYASAHASQIDPEDLAAAAEAIGDRSFAREIQQRMLGHVSWMAIEDAARFDALESD